MKTINSNVKLLRRAVKTDSKGILGVAAITAIEVELNRLKHICSVGSFILAEQDVRALSNLCRIHAQLKVDVSNHFQKLKSSSSGARKLMVITQTTLNLLLEDQIKNLETRLSKFSGKLFKKTFASRAML